MTNDNLKAKSDNHRAFSFDSKASDTDKDLGLSVCQVGQHLATVASGSQILGCQLEAKLPDLGYSEELASPEASQILAAQNLDPAEELNVDNPGIFFQFGCHAFTIFFICIIILFNII